MSLCLCLWYCQCYLLKSNYISQRCQAETSISLLRTYVSHSSWTIDRTSWKFMKCFLGCNHVLQDKRLQSFINLQQKQTLVGMVKELHRTRRDKPLVTNSGLDVGDSIYHLPPTFSSAHACAPPPLPLFILTEDADAALKLVLEGPGTQENSHFCRFFLPHRGRFISPLEC